MRISERIERIVELVLADGIAGVPALAHQVQVQLGRRLQRRTERPVEREEEEEWEWAGVDMLLWLLRCEEGAGVMGTAAEAISPRTT